MLLQTIQPADAERLKQPVRAPAMSSKFFTLALHVALPVAIDATIDARLVDSQGSLSSVGLLQVSTDAGGFGSVCGANEASADAPRPPKPFAQPCFPAAICHLPFSF